LRSGRATEACAFLRTFLADHPDAGQAWWLLSFAASTLEEKLDAVQHVLRMAPDSQTARQRFLALQAEASARRNSETQAVSPPPRERGPSRLKGSQRWEIGGLAALFVLVAGAAMVLLIGWYQQTHQPPPPDLQATLQVAQALTSRPPQVLEATWTPTPAWTVLPSSSPTVTMTVTSTLQLDVTLLGHVGPYLNDYPPDFSLVDAGSLQKDSLSQFKGEPILLIFMISACPACENEMGSLETLYQTYHPSGLVMLGVDFAEDGLYVRGVMAEHSLTFPVLLDRDGAVTDLFQVGHTPTHFFIRPDGRIAAIAVSEITLDDMVQYCRVILRGYPTPTP
jgi:peroxiredoxin